jgi:signal transduction histidine kinase
MAEKRKKVKHDDRLAFYEQYQDQILAEQVRQLYRLAPLGLVATWLNSLLLFFVMKDVMPYRFLIPWLAAILIITLLRGWLILTFKAADPEPASAPLWANRFRSGLITIGVAWGSIALAPLSNLSMAHQVFIAFVLGGMAAGASSTFSTVRSAYAAFAIPALAPLAVHFLIVNDTFHYVMAAMLILYSFLLWRISLHNYQVNRTSLLLRYENREMIETLEQAKDRAEGLNAQLLKEIDARLAAEADLRTQQEQLERLVEERTAELREINEQLKIEIEDRKRYEKALLESGERLAAAQRASEAANVAKSEFLANMSHEMRTPLAGTLGMLKLVLDMEIGEEERQLLEMAKRSADSLLRIIADVLDFARLDAGMMRFERKPFSLRGVVASAVEVVSLNARQKGLLLSWSVDDSVPRELVGDEGRLRQVLVNLLGNAVKFTERGQVEVTARIHDAAGTGEEADSAPARQQQHAAFIVFAVHDTGPGIPPDQLDRIFGRFTQVDSSLTRKHGGTGLGLALTRQLVEKMGGSIWAESSVGVGSTFYFTIATSLEDVAH